MGEVAATRKVAFVDLFRPTHALMDASGDKGEEPLTINGVHLNDRGDEAVAALIDRALFGARPASVKADLARLRAAVLEKDLQFFYDYRAINGCYIYGGRKTPFGVVNFPEEFAKLRKMIANREARVWAIARGEAVPTAIDDSGTGTLERVATNATREIKLTNPEESRQTFTLPEGYESQPLRLRGRLPRPQKAGPDDLRRPGAALGHDHAVVPRCTCPAGRSTTRS